MHCLLQQATSTTADDCVTNRLFRPLAAVGFGWIICNYLINKGGESRPSKP
jgi:hypothetical protein